MAVSQIPEPSTSKTRYMISLTSGTSWTVPSGVTRVNVVLVGGGGGGGGAGSTGGTGGTGGTTTFTGATSASGGGGGNGAICQGVSQNSTAGTAGTAAVGSGGMGGVNYYQTGPSSGYVLLCSNANQGHPGQQVASSVATTPGASISYAIGAGGTGGTAINGISGGAGGSGRIDIEYYV